MRRGRQDPRLRRRDQQRWGSCCTRQSGAATRRAIAWYGQHDVVLHLPLLWEQDKRRTLGKFLSLVSISFLHALSSLMQTANRPPSLIASSLPFSQSLSPASKDASAREVVVERRWSWSRVTERELLVGRIRRVSRLPQYLEMR